MRIADIAHSRAGDKGPFVTLSLTPFDASDYAALKKDITVEYVAHALAWLFPRGVRRFEVEGLQSLHFVGKRAESDSVTLSLALDRHGKSISSLLVDLPYPDLSAPSA